ncbi:MAG: D-alanyl-D-alanine carboxypeptidase family protein [Thermaerobacterales bacterium]
MISEALKRNLRAAAWICAIAMLAAVTLPGGAGAIQRDNVVSIPSQSADQAAGQGILADIDASALVVMEILTGQVVLERNSHEALYPASITKIMTMLVVMEALADGRIALDDEVVISAQAATWGGTQIFLEAGEVLLVKDLLKSVAIASANDAAVALSEHVAGSTEEFVALMNQRAQELGMTETHFSNPHGIDDGLEVSEHHMSAHDIALASRALIRSYPEVLEWTGTWMDKVRDPDAGDCCELVNTNRLVRRLEGVDGLKTGHTSRAGFGMSLTGRRGDTRFVVVVMGYEQRPQRDEDAAKLLNWAFSQWEAVPIIKAGETVHRLPIDEGVSEQVDLVAADDFSVLIPRGQSSDLEQELTVPERRLAPVERAQSLGRLEVMHKDKSLGTVELVARQHVERLSLSVMWLRLLMKIWPWH